MWEGKRRNLVETLYIVFFPFSFSLKGDLFMRMGEGGCYEQDTKRNKTTTKGEDGRNIGWKE